MKAPAGLIAPAVGFLVDPRRRAAMLFGLPHVLDIVRPRPGDRLCSIMAMFALSQGFLWGYGGIMSFGQAAFFGLGGYAYAIAALNMGESTAARPAGHRGADRSSRRCSAISCSTAASATPISASSR